MDYKFYADKVAVDEVAKFAYETWNDDADVKLIMLRDPKQSELGLLLIMETPEDSREAHEALLDEIKDKLYKRFVIAFKGWGGSNRTFVIKGLDELRN